MLSSIDNDTIGGAPVFAQERSPWEWRPPHAGWFASLHAAIARWEPSPDLSVGGGAIRELLHAAAERGEPWLMHPALNAVLLDSAACRVGRDLALLSWIAAHDLWPGVVTAAEPFVRWTADGGVLMDAGIYDAATLAATTDASPPWLPVDPWCATTGMAMAGSWAEPEALDDAEQTALRSAVHRHCRYASYLGTALPACHDWIRAVTGVAIPLRSDDGGVKLRSSSSEAFPGLILLDIPQEFALFVELVVHESAHRHFYCADAATPLVDPQHHRLYPSPLRPDPRPLRAVFLAYHAVAYITAAYRELDARGLLTRPSLRDEWQNMSEKLPGTRSTLESAAAHLTDEGVEFLQRTSEVAAHGSA